MQRMRTNDRMIRYKILSCNVFSDTLISETAPKRGNKYAKLFATYFGWAQAYPMKTKDNAYESLLFLFQWTGVPDHIILDGSKDQFLGSFEKKCLEAGCRSKQTEPYYTWKNATEGMIRYIKRGAGRKMNKSRITKKLWDHCLEVEGLIFSHTSRDILNIAREVPETAMMGDMVEIIIIEDHACYDWIKFHDPVGNSSLKEICIWEGTWDRLLMLDLP